MHAEAKFEAYKPISRKLYQSCYREKSILSQPSLLLLPVGAFLPYWRQNVFVLAMQTATCFPPSSFFHLHLAAIFHMHFLIATRALSTEDRQLKQSSLQEISPAVHMCLELIPANSTDADLEARMKHFNIKYLQHKCHAKTVWQCKAVGTNTTIHTRGDKTLSFDVSSAAEAVRHWRSFLTSIFVLGSATQRGSPGCYRDRTWGCTKSTRHATVLVHALVWRSCSRPRHAKHRELVTIFCTSPTSIRWNSRRWDFGSLAGPITPGIEAKEVWTVFFSTGI